MKRKFISPESKAINVMAANLMAASAQITGSGSTSFNSATQGGNNEEADAKVFFLGF